MKVIFEILLGLIIISCSHKRPPEAIVIEEPSVSQKNINEENYLILLLKNGTLWYKYGDSVESENGLQEIKPYTTAAIVKVLDDVETRFHIDLSKMGDHVLIKADANLPYPSFKVIKEALKSKEIFKFKLVTTGEPTPKAPEIEPVLQINEKAAVTFLLSANNAVYYYEGIFNGTILKTDLNSVSKLIKRYKNSIKSNDLMFIIKSDKDASFKSVIDVLDQMVLNKIQNGHYAEIDITDKEIESINNFKEN